MEELKLLIDWIVNAFLTIYNFFKVQHPIVQACVFMPLAVLVINLFIGVVNFAKGRKE